LPATAVRKIYSDAKGRVWAGTRRGISLFYPDADPDPPITKIIEDRNLRETPPGGEVRLTFLGTDKWKFTSADRLTFSWRMDGAAWSGFEPSQFASFKGLDSGSHRFEVRAMDRNGNIDSSPAIYQFAVLPPWYLHREFLLLAALAISIIYYLSRHGVAAPHEVGLSERHDPLTGLANRAEFEIRFQQALTEARAGNVGVAMILLDLDRFKPVNDTLGHGIGDCFLRETGARLRSVVRKQDTLARMGGDEFAIVMPAIAGRAEAETMAQRILRVGVSLFPEHGEDAATLHRLADMAMYQCKAQNKDDYAVRPRGKPDGFSLRANGRTDPRGTGKWLFRNPLSAGEKDRWGALRTGSAHPAATSAVRLDPAQRLYFHCGGHRADYARGRPGLREACRQMAAWHRAGFKRLRISVNVSAVQLARANFAESVKAALNDTGLDACALMLELTETALMQHLAECRWQIEQLRSWGIRIALDDFGTGYSALSSLHLLPIDRLEIDCSFTARIGESARGLIVIRKVVGLGHEFGFEVVAEGVETAGQLAGLESIGCDGVQGFLPGRPACAEANPSLLKADSFRLSLSRAGQIAAGAVL
jgi:EAL domain-containing protein (putative c-di-GMP-specific phosphodiesterase class I)/GGDEF domain-containing protein